MDYNSGRFCLPDLQLNNPGTFQCITRGLGRFSNSHVKNSRECKSEVYIATGISKFGSSNSTMWCIQHDSCTRNGTRGILNSYYTRAIRILLLTSALSSNYKKQNCKQGGKTANGNNFLHVN
jgi:hypothetical protein